MGVFDGYVPDPPLSCPVCASSLSDWQGKDVDCGLFVWRQGLVLPSKQAVPEEVTITDAELSTCRLPHTFAICSYDCDCPFPVEAIGTCSNGVWARTEVVTAATARQKPGEGWGAFKARLKWLSGARD